MWGVVRQQLLVHHAIPYTSHNSSACAIVDMTDASLLKPLINAAVEHIESLSFEGSDPGLCVACENGSALDHLIAFGQSCTAHIMSQREALQACAKVHLSAHGGTGDGIIGAAAAVGLTGYGWAGRFIEFGGLRHVPDVVRVSELARLNILVVSIDRNAKVPGPDDVVHTKQWLRPSLLAGRAVLMTTPRGNGVWESLGEKRNKRISTEKVDSTLQSVNVRYSSFVPDDNAL